jgi:hypothetical protein
MSTQESYELITITTAQTILDCREHSLNGCQMVRAAAQDAALYPLKPKDRRILKSGMGEERLKRFTDLCKGRNV